MTTTQAWKNLLLFCATFLLTSLGSRFLFFVMTVHIYDLSRSSDHFP